MSQSRPSDVSLTPDDERSSLIEQVLFDHIQRRLQGDEVIDDELVDQHPELLPELADRLRIAREFSDLRDSNAPLESVYPGSGVLTVRCPQCREPVQVPADASFQDITCSCCGSRFSLETVRHRLQRLLRRSNSDTLN